MYLKYKDTDNCIKIAERASKHIEPHIHSAIEIVYVKEGTLEMGMGTDLFHMEEGDLGIIFPNIIHHYQVFSEGKNKVCFIQMIPAVNEAIYKKISEFIPEDPVIHKDCIDNTLKNIIEAVVNPEERNGLILASYIQTILAKCMPIFTLIERNDVSNEDIISQVVSYVSSNFQEALSLDKMSLDLGVSKYALSRVFSGTFHRNFNQYLNDVRLNYALHCMETTNDTILDICMESGFESQRTFNRVFKDRFHMTPREYRKTILV